MPWIYESNVTSYHNIDNIECSFNMLLCKARMRRLVRQFEQISDRDLYTFSMRLFTFCLIDLNPWLVTLMMCQLPEHNSACLLKQQRNKLIYIRNTIKLESDACKCSYEPFTWQTWYEVNNTKASVLIRSYFTFRVDKSKHRLNTKCVWAHVGCYHLIRAQNEKHLGYKQGFEQLISGQTDIQ